MNYSGHQFGNFVHELGDGRAVLLGEINNQNGNYDIQLKGSGLTKFSRQGDGRSALGPVIREYIVSEAMHYLDVPTSRALAAVATGEYVARDNFEPGGILTRVAKSHLRVGTFEYFASRQQWQDVKLPADFAIQRHYPEIRETNNHYLELLKKVAENQSILISKWMAVGFVHGVMNTDNFSISGETIDYGPCAFLDEYHPGKVFSSIDQNGRYAFGNQPSISAWNLASLAGCLIAFIDKDSDKANELATEVLDNFSVETNQRILNLMCQKIGLDGSIKEALDHYLDNYGKLLDKWDSVLAEKDVKKINISDDVINAFRAKAADPIRDAWIADMEGQGLPGQELYDLVQATLAKAKAGN